MKNIEIAKILNEIAEMLEMQDVQFKPRAYQKAARVVESLSEDIEEVYKRGELEKLPGVGESIAQKIEEMIKTGKLKYYLQLKKKMPMDVDELMRVPGMGPKRIKLLYQKLKVKNLKDLEKAAKQHRIEKIKGLGPKVEEDILKGIKFARKKRGRFLLGYIIPDAEEIKNKIKKLRSVKQIEIAGSYRRRKETVGDVDILVTSSKPKEVMDYFVSMPDVSDVMAKGMTKSMVRLHNGLQVDVRVLKEKEYGSALQYFTGNKEHNIELRKIALSKGYTLSEYGLFKLKGKKWIAGRTEEEIYKKLGVDWMPPEMRENNGEIEAAQKHKLPKLIGYGAAKGDFQTQTNWSDGADSIEELAKMGIKLGWKFITITDHVGQLAITHALNEKRLAKQAKEIDKLNKKLNIHIFKGAEVDILKNGKLALSKKAQEKLDFVLASVHLATKMSAKEMTARICSAFENERIHALAHPTGRLLQEREPYALNMEKLFECAKANNVFLEINSYPERMDLSGEYVKAAKEVGCKFIISTDAHSEEHLRYLDLGVALARRGWLEAKDVLNTKPVKEIEKVLKSK